MSGEFNLPIPADPTSFGELETVPTVSFDIRLGKKYDYIDFVYPAYDEYLREQGLTSRDIESTTVNFKTRKSTNMTLGVHNLLTNKTTVRLGAGDAGVENNILAHETWHRIEDVTKSKWRRLETLPSAIFTTVGLLRLISGYSELMQEPRGTDMKDFLTGHAMRDIVWGVGNLVLASLLLHYSGEERRARKAANEAPKFLTLVK